MTPRSWLPGRACALALAVALAAAAAAPAARADEPATAAASAPAAAPAAATAATIADDDAGAPFVDEIVVVGRRPRAEVAADPTASATVISADRFAGEAKGVAQLVATAPGVAVNEYGGLGHLSTVSIRGSTSSGVLVLLDGLPLNTAAGGGVDLATIPRTWISRIEIARGVEGAHYGAGALGGVVNVVTGRPREGSWAAEASAGSFETFTAAGERSVGGERWTLLSQADVERSGGAFSYEYARLSNLGVFSPYVRSNNDSLRVGGLVKLAAAVLGGRLDALAQVTGGSRGLPGWPYTSENDRQEDARALATARFARSAGRDLTLAARGSARFDRLDLRLDDLGGGTARQRGGAAGIDAEAVLRHALGELRARAGAEEEALSSQALGGTRSRASLSASAAEDLSLWAERLAVAPALRVDRVGPFAGVSGKLGARWRLASALAARASAGHTFRPPSFAELFLQQGLIMPNPNLRAEEGLGADAGIVYDGPLGLASLGAHATLYRDLIQYQATGFGRAKPFNAGKALVRGIEAEAATAPIRAALGLALSASYTLLVTENLRGDREEEVGKDLPFRPRHRLYARAAVAPGPASFHLETHFVGAQYRDARNLERVPGALVWNAGASLRVARRPDVSVHLEVRNLLDDRRLLDPLAGPLPGRMVMVTLRAGSPVPGGPQQ